MCKVGCVQWWKSYNIYKIELHNQSNVWLLIKLKSNKTFINPILLHTSAQTQYEYTIPNEIYINQNIF